MNLRSLIIVLCVFISGVFGSKILLIFSLPSKSHYILGRALATGLVDAGHDITMITAFNDTPPEGKGTFRFITVKNCAPVDNDQGFNYFDIEKMTALSNLFILNSMGEMCTKTFLENQGVKELLQSNEEFDVVIVESLLTDALSAFGCHFNVPLILLSPVGSAQWLNDKIGNPSPPSYFPNILQGFQENMNFWQRSQSTLMNLLVRLNSKLVANPNHDRLIKEHFPNCPTVEDTKISLILANSHESTNPALPHVPNMIDIGGFHISPAKKLPADLQNLLDNAKDGVVYFSFGSHVRPSHMPNGTRNILINVLGSLKQTVLWKWDDDSLAEIPKNIIVGKWFPQQEILAHPNTKLFITHGGLLSLTETIHEGVPILAMPILGDQKFNANRATYLEIGESLSLSEITEDAFRAVLEELLTNPKYTENVKRRSRIIRDRPQHPLDVAVYWIEYVIRHNGAPHLSVVGAGLPWYQYFLVDVIVIWSLIFLVPIYCITKVFRKVCCNEAKKRKLKEQ